MGLKQLAYRAKNASPKKWLEILALVLIMAVVTAIVVYEEYHPIECQERSVVKSIKELKYRDAVVVLENGQDHTVNQASLKPGDTICTKWGRKE